MSGIEVNLRCGDTITVSSMPAIGAYRYCEHCDGRRQVIGVPVVDVTPRCLTSVDQYNRARNAMTEQFIAGNMTEAHWQWQYTIYQTFVDQLEGWSFGAYRW